MPTTITWWRASTCGPTARTDTTWITNGACAGRLRTARSWRAGTSPLTSMRRMSSLGKSHMPSAQLYDAIGATYSVTRRTEPRIAARIWTALGDSRTVVNVGAGTGSYEP